MTKNTLDLRIGIIGGGQLGKMMILEAKKLGFNISILDPTENCPAHSISDSHIVAAFNDKAAIRELAERTDVITYELEHIDSEELLELEKEGYKVYPTAESLKVIQNKFDQKQKLRESNIPVADFMQILSVEELRNAGELFGYPFILKACTGGYDGRGNFFIEKEDYLQKAFDSLGSGKIPLMAEKLVDFTMETSVLACRAINGEIKVYPVGNNIHKDNILHETIVPAEISNETTKTAMDLAYKVMEIFKGVGMFCIEMFVTNDGEVLINEIAPRPHNSGHYSIEGCRTSQFENHIRAITGLPLGDVDLICPTVMVNLLGEEGCNGKTYVLGLNEALKLKGVKIHIYGKQDTIPKRKMGHITVTAPTLKEALKNAEEAYNMIKIIADTNLKLKQ